MLLPIQGADLAKSRRSCSVGKMAGQLDISLASVDSIFKENAL
jgi:hypothetical protein